ncbi:maleylpyruvate isomerase N-terminal domain-containing protein [Pseudonocardia kunmingensis]|uniref:Mycothiol maleylpyruvate isomerase-like protein n=1 Tax=Pseudonocardia kunmingensis TaxID=630975 RepID=A0A543DIC4_9PSEU|nr:maleylpyruvate isomerase N-terminal domain-containing protein [Pseudonocardia kunmingensis]TQM09082.1 mycothiol maleylpyruvate isomerase-like protein [Pseudonocardia kunmingensis]
MDRSTPESLDGAFLDGAAVAAELLRHAAVRDRWPEGSALPEMSVGALACHLSRQVGRVAQLLGRPSTLPVLASVDEHYARAEWVTSRSPHDPVNDRSSDDAEAELGHARMLERLEGDTSRATEHLRSGTAQDAIDIPWQGWALRRDHFLHTRLLEIVVHTTDLAESLQLPAPEFPGPAFAPVRDLLVRLVVRRHGQAAVISTLTRAERARNISAF